MGITIAEWEEHFESLSSERRRELYNAIKTIESDPVFYEHYRWTGLFTLAISIMIVETKVRREATNGKDGPDIQKVIFDQTQNSL